MNSQNKRKFSPREQTHLARYGTKKVNLEDWHYSKVDYDFLTDKTILVNSHFPEIQNNNVNSPTIPELYTYFNNQNSYNKIKHIKNFKYGHSMSNLT